MSKGINGTYLKCEWFFINIMSCFWWLAHRSGKTEGSPIFWARVWFCWKPWAISAWDCVIDCTLYKICWSPASLSSSPLISFMFVLSSDSDMGIRKRCKMKSGKSGSKSLPGSLSECWKSKGELRDRCLRATDGNQKSNASFFGMVLPLTTDRKSSCWWLWLDVTNAMVWKRSKQRKIQFPVTTRSSKTSVLKLPNEKLMKRKPIHRIYSINCPGRLFNFGPMRVGACSRWALIIFPTFSTNKGHF